MLEYSFLILVIVLAIPGTLTWVMRPDLRGIICWMALASLPFALTERLFYPDYWEPKFLFDLVNVIGFGIEDILFVVGLAAHASTAWAWVARRRYVQRNDMNRTQVTRRVAAIMILCFGAVGAIAFVDVPMIYGAPMIMTAMAVGIWTIRPDLIVGSLGGAAITTVVYTAVCLVLMAFIPEVFELDWKTEKFLDTFVLGVPVEELLYASTSGLVATSFYPFVTGTAFSPIDD